MSTNIYRLKPYKDKILRMPAMWLWEHGIGANQITTAGLATGIGAAACIMTGYDWAALVMLAISVGADLLDGAAARLTKTDKLSGKLYDAICDRVVELGWIGALIEKGILDWWALSLGLGSIMLLICRCWAYRLRGDSSGVAVTRFERIIALVVAAVLPWRGAALCVYLLVTAGTWLSCFQIIRMILNSGFRIHPDSLREKRFLRRT